MEHHGDSINAGVEFGFIDAEKFPLTRTGSSRQQPAAHSALSFSVFTAKLRSLVKRET
jgi:hypothetical protein